MARALALDLGSKRIGVASSDTTRTLASPVTVLERRGNHAADHKAIADIIAEYEPDVLVVGLPLSLTGAEGHATKLIRNEVAEMELVFQIPIVFHDERFTTATAHASMKERKMNEKDRRKVVDKVAAAVLLQAWLDGEQYRSRAANEAREKREAKRLSKTNGTQPKPFDPITAQSTQKRSAKNGPTRNSTNDSKTVRDKQHEKTHEDVDAICKGKFGHAPGLCAG